MDASTTASSVWKIFQDDSSSNNNNNNGNKKLVFFVERRSSTFRLEPIIRQYCDAKVQMPLVQNGPSVVLVEMDRLYDSLGLLRALQHDIARYNHALAKFGMTEEFRYASYRLDRQATAFGFQLLPSSEKIPMNIPGLDDLVIFLEEQYSDKIALAQANIQDGAIEYESLAEYFCPGKVLVDTGLLSGLPGTKFLTTCRASYYRRGKTSTGATASTFYASLECVVAVGYQRFAVVEASFVQSSFEGTRRVDGSEILLEPTPDDYRNLTMRGQRYQDMCATSSCHPRPTLVEYKPGSFYSHERPSRSGGRLVVDATEAWSHGVHPAKPPADGMAAEAVLEAIQCMARFQRQPIESRDENTLGALFLKAPLMDSLLPCTWPVVCGFSLATRTWGLGVVDCLTPVVFCPSVFDDLVLPATRKRLLRALITSHAQRTNVDVLPGKGEGLIFLLHGSPGTGKTLTAEAVAEVLQLPLYRVSMGELGTTPEQLEDRLQKIFDLCLPWNALVLIDEAEILLEARQHSSDLVRNAMVCVMLRLIEYFPGILFLTTNSGMNRLDPAIVSRLTCALHYQGLDECGRKQVFATAMRRLEGSCQVTDSDLDWLAKASDGINGRQIKNSVQLATALSLYEKQPLTLEHLKETLAMTTTLNISDNVM